MKIHDLSIFVALTALAAVPAITLAGDVPCPPDPGAVTIDGDVVIAAPCVLDGTTVKGNVKLYAGGSLLATQARIEGSLQAENADFIDVDDSHVNGNIQLDNLVGDDSIVSGSTIGGSIQLKSNRSRLEVLDNIVTADVQAFGNTGGVLIEDNIIDGNLQCKENEPPPAGGNNRVAGNREDQCEDLQPESAASGAAAQGSAGVQAAESQSGGGGRIDLLLALLLLTGLLLLRKRSPAIRFH